MNESAKILLEKAGRNLKVAKSNLSMGSNIAKTTKYSNYLTDNERKALSELKEKIAEKYPGAKLILYGSKASGDYNQDSDINLPIVIYDDYKIGKNISFEELRSRYFMRVSGDIREKILGIIVNIE